MKYLNKNTLVSFALGLLLSVGLVYAVDIINLSQHAVSGDKVTSTWVNAVNTKLGTVDALGGQYQISCYMHGTAYSVCVRLNTTTGVTEAKYNNNPQYNTWLSVGSAPW